MSKKRKRRRFTPEQKASILGEHLFGKKPISEVCEAHQLQPSVVYDWQRHAQANLAQALEPGQSQQSRRERELADELARLRAELTRKTDVIAEITEEYVTLKKGLSSMFSGSFDACSPTKALLTAFWERFATKLTRFVT